MPPVLVDLTKDGVLDIVMALFNSSVIAIDGLTFRKIWSYTTAHSESYSTPAAAYFNNDNIPDFFINYSVGPGYPLYYYSESTVLDGKTGRPLLRQPFRHAVAIQSSPLAVSMENGSDYFLYWVSGCHGIENEADFTEQFRFAKGTIVYQQSRSNLCQLRFKKQGYSRLYAVSQHTAPPGVLVYDSGNHPESAIEGLNDNNYSLKND